jgi:WD40 repeat protein
MKARFDDRIFNFPLPPGASGETPGVCLTRRRLLGLLGAGAFAGLPRAARAAICSTGAYANEILIASLSFFPNGNTLVSAGQDSFVKFWTIPNGALFRSIATDAVPVQVAVSPNGNYIAVAMAGGHLELWSADGGTRRALAGHTDTVNAVAFTADSAQLVSVSQDRSTRIWSVADAKLLRTFSDTTDVMARVAIPPAVRVPAGRGTPPRRLLVTSGTHVYLRSLSTGAILQTVAGKALAVSPDGQFLAAQDGARLYMDAFPSLASLVSLVDQQNATSLSFSADGKLLAVAYTDGPAQLYSAPDLTLKVEMAAAQPPCLSTAMDPRNHYLAVASGKSIYLYTLPAGTLVPVCFMDIAASSPASSGTQYLEGGLIYTVACGVSTPDGFACTCNCVPGDCPCVNDTGCSCVSDTGCSCVSDTGCSCDSNTGCSCVGDVGCSCNADYGCGCVDDTGCGCDGDSGCGCDGDVGCGCDGDVGCGCDGDVGRR